MKKLAARDFEDILQASPILFHLYLAQQSQCSLPCFEGLLPEPHNKIVLDLLFDCSNYHAHAKLRLQTDSTIFTFRLATRSIGQALRKWFKITCQAFATRETPRESQSRKRAATKRKAENIPDSKKKNFNMYTYKGHALGHAVNDVIQFGTGDATSTQPVRIIQSLLILTEVYIHRASSHTKM